MQCKAKSKRSQERCKRHATPGMEVCNMHGGKSLKGIASPTFKNGRYSKFIPARLSARYTEAQKDSELLALRDDISLLDARLADVLSRVDTGESGRLWRALQAKYDEMVAAQAKQDIQSAMLALADLGALIQQGMGDWGAWHEVSSLLDQRRKLVESERKRLVEMQQMISAENVMVLIGAIAGVIRQHVTDRTALAAISQELNRLTAIDAGR